MSDGGSTSTAEDPALRVIGGRYALIDIVGEGGAGVVYRAEDRFTGNIVAVKSLRPGVLSPEPRIRREIAAMRLLRLPGVVTLLDEAEEEGEVHLVMDLVAGEPFPGPTGCADWESLGPIVRSLLETLGRVHAAGVVHRDLKPANVLVDDEGRVTLLDFGLSYGPALGGGLTIAGGVVGTPEYLAPEQIRGRGIDGRTDLYALGVMVFEACAGRMPIDASDFADLMHRKLSGSTIPLVRAATQLPRHVAETIDRMLCVDPDDRPQSAAQALQMLYGGTPDTFEAQLPRLGSSEPFERLVAAGVEGRAIDVFGALGSGRSRLLAEAAVALAAQGRNVLWVLPGKSPYTSLAPILGGFAGLEDLTRDEAFAALDGRLRKCLAAGDVVMADDLAQIDPWSVRALDSCRDAGAIVRVVSEATPDCVELGSFAAEDLRGLFAGPSRILHLPEDAADELWRRTGGQPARIRAEVSAWVRHGLARWKDGKIAIDRAALNRLHGGLPVGGGFLVGARAAALRSSELEELLAWIALAWPHTTFELLSRVVGRPKWMLEPEIDMLLSEGLVRQLEDGRLQPLVLPDALQLWTDDLRQAAHRSLADALPRGVPARLRHLAAAGEPHEVVAESLALGHELVEAGKTGDALVALSHGLDAARRENDADAYDKVLHTYVRACLSEGTATAANEALYEIGRAPSGGPATKRLHEFLLAVLETHQGDPERALHMLEACGAFDDEDLELWRQAQRVTMCERISMERLQRLLDELGAWAEGTGNPRAVSNHRMWTASLRRRQHRFDEAAALYLETADSDERAQLRMAELLNAAAVLLDAGRCEEAAEVVATAREIAETCRHPLYEAHAESLQRDLHYRLGRELQPDHELLDAIAQIGAPELEGLVAQTEAAVAWRGGLLDEGRALAHRAAATFAATGRRAPYLLSRCLEIDCGAPTEPAEVEAIVAEAAQAEDRIAAAQTLGLIAPHAGALQKRVREALEEIADAIPDGEMDNVAEAISVREALQRAATG